MVLILNSFLLSNLTTMSFTSSGAYTPSLGSIVKISLVLLFFMLNPYLIGYFLMFFKVSFLIFVSPILTASKSIIFSVFLKSISTEMSNASVNSWISCDYCLILNPSVSFIISYILWINWPCIVELKLISISASCQDLKTQSVFDIVYSAGRGSLLLSSQFTDIWQSFLIIRVCFIVYLAAVCLIRLLGCIFLQLDSIQFTSRQTQLYKDCLWSNTQFCLYKLWLRQENTRQSDFVFLLFSGSSILVQKLMKIFVLSGCCLNMKSQDITWWLNHTFHSL